MTRTGARLLWVVCFSFGGAAAAWAEVPTSSTAGGNSVTTGEKGDTGYASGEAFRDRLRDVLRGKDQTGTPKPPPEGGHVPTSSVAFGKKRVRPNYEGREPTGVTARDLIWIPRALFYPVHLGLDFLVRRPIVGGLTLMEKHFVFTRIHEFLTWRDGKSGVFPSFLVDFGLRPSVGLTTFHRDLFVRGHELTAAASTWGENWIRVAGQDRMLVFDDDSGWLTFSAEFLTRPDWVFYGVGPLTSTDDESFIRMRRIEVGVELRAFLQGLNRFAFSVMLRDVAFLEDEAANPTVESVHTGPLPSGLGQGSLPPGYRSGSGLAAYQLIDARLEAVIDTRIPDREFNPGSGFRLELFGSFEFDPSETSINFFRWGSEWAAFLDLSGVNHVLALRIYSEFVEDTGGRQVPFTELAALGGLETMRGYLQNRFLGDSAFVSTLSYRYPVWSLLDAELFASLGNVFDGHYRDFSFRKMYLNGGLGLRTTVDREVALMILFAVGTNRLDQDDVTVDSFRFTFGITQGF